MKRDDRVNIQSQTGIIMKKDAPKQIMIIKSIAPALARWLLKTKALYPNHPTNAPKQNAIKPVLTEATIK
jgi:hypothetical protein